MNSEERIAKMTLENMVMRDTLSTLRLIFSIDLPKDPALKTLIEMIDDAVGVGGEFENALSREEDGDPIPSTRSSSDFNRMTPGAKHVIVGVAKDDHELAEVLMEVLEREAERLPLVQYGQDDFITTINPN